MVNVENSASTTVIKPTRNYKREVEKQTSLQKDDPAMGFIQMELCTNNPVAFVPLPEFITLLRLAIQSQDFCTGSTNTKTTIEMRLGLRMLMGEDVGRDMWEPFPWHFTLEHLGPFVACIYHRMHAEVRMLNTTGLPDVESDR